MHPIVIASLTLWLVNDHILKNVAPSWFTGKLSDAAGLVAFPVILAATVELLGIVRARRGIVECAAGLTAIVFASIQLSDWMAYAFSLSLGAAQWPVYAAHAALLESPLPGLYPVVHTMDSSDLLVLPFALISPALARRANRSNEAA